MGSCLSGPDDRRRAPHSLPSPAGRMKAGKKGNLKGEQLRRIPGRRFMNGSSEVASLFTQQGRKGINQDAMIVWEDFGSKGDAIFCGVFDGHGPFGHVVARRVRDSLPLKLSAIWDSSASGDELRQNGICTSGCIKSDKAALDQLDEEFVESVGPEEKEKYPEIFTKLKETFLKAFQIMDKELKLHPKIDCFCSGTTAVTLIKQGQDLVIGNIGDSRAILGTRGEDDCLIAVQLTVDLKPNLPKEEERIKQCNGRVFALQDEPEVARVWLPYSNSPGLAMARAFGDFCLKDFGLISVPEISYRRLTERDDFIVLASDGIWDVLSNNEVVEIVASAPCRSSAARFLVESAVRAWRHKYPTSKVDDCAVVCLFLSADGSDSVASYSDSREHSESSVIPETDNDESSAPTLLDRSVTVRSTCETFLDKTKESPKKIKKSHSGKRSTNGNNTTEIEHDWSALEGVSRVNTLLTLPRFVPVKDKHPADGKLQK